MEECGIVRGGGGLMRGLIGVCFCRRCEMIPIAAVVVAIMIRYGF